MSYEKSATQFNKLNSRLLDEMTSDDQLALEEYKHQICEAAKVLIDNTEADNSEEKMSEILPYLLDLLAPLSSSPSFSSFSPSFSSSSSSSSSSSFSSSYSPLSTLQSFSS